MNKKQTDRKDRERGRNKKERQGVKDTKRKKEKKRERARKKRTRERKKERNICMFFSLFKAGKKFFGVSQGFTQLHRPFLRSLVRIQIEIQVIGPNSERFEVIIPNSERNLGHQSEFRTKFKSLVQIQDEIQIHYSECCPKI